MKSVELQNKTFELFIDQERINTAVKKIASEIDAYYKNKPEPIVLISILDGSFIFMADLVRYIQKDLEIEFVKLKSYEGTNSRGEIAHLLKLSKSLKGKHAIVVEDIIDTGLTIDVFLEELEKKDSLSIKVCTLLSKPDIHNDIVNIDFLGLEIPPDFVIGYGLDIDGLGRNLPDIYKLKV